jgi:15-cis-phytoene synthase
VASILGARQQSGLDDSYRRCRELHRRHGRSYYLATRLLPQWKRRHVHALYGFARHVDEMVDSTAALPAGERERRLRDFSDRFLAGLAGAPVDNDPLLPAVLHTIAVFQLAPADFESFLRSMAMDLTVTEYADYPALLSYMEGSAAVICTMMLPILGPADPAAAREPARQLGLAFQLTNFLRDVPEDLDRGRIYLPLADLEKFGVRPADLRGPSDRTRDLIAFEVDRARAHYRRAEPGIAMLDPASQACIRTAYHLYGGILDEIELAGYDVFTRRATVPTRRRLAVAVTSYLGVVR